MRTDDLRLRVLAVTLLSTVAALAVAAVLLLATWPVDLRPALRDWAAQRGVLIVFALLLGAVAGLVVAWTPLARRLGFVPRLSHALELLGSSRPDLRVAAEDGVPAGLAAAVNGLADRYERRHRDSEDQIALATQRLAEERDLLGAVLADLPAAVLACSRDGRILLYTPRAAELVRTVAPDAFLGLGRTVFALFRRSAIVHALERLDLAEARAEARPAAAALLTTRGGTLLHARFTPLAAASVHGFFLNLLPVEKAQDSTSDDDSRRSLTNLRAAAEMLADFPQMSAAERARFVAVVDEESARLVGTLGAPGSDRWPLEDIAADTLLPLLQSALQSGVDRRIELPQRLPQDWVAAETFSLAALLRDFCVQVERDGARTFRLDLQSQPPHARLELRWMPAGLLAAETWAAWEQTSLTADAGRLPLSPAAIARGHGGELWQQRNGDTARLCLLLPRTDAPPQQTASPEPRVEYAPVQSGAGDALLRDRVYTAFDTETTGLDPSGGDQIIAIGGIRIVDGRILSREVFETLVATGRRIDPAAQRVHGIDASMLHDQPPADVVLPRFRRFCEDTVLLGHNAAFDLRFFELQGRDAGVRFDLPVLDTLLLSQLVYPQPDAHRLEVIAERLGLSVLGRHTALGDAILTAEVFLRLLPLLAARGIHTLAQALEASAKTGFAKLRY